MTSCIYQLQIDSLYQYFKINTENKKIDWANGEKPADLQKMLKDKILVTIGIENPKGLSKTTLSFFMALKEFYKTEECSETKFGHDIANMLFTNIYIAIDTNKPLPKKQGGVKVQIQKVEEAETKATEKPKVVKEVAKEEQKTPKTPKKMKKKASTTQKKKN